MNARFLAAMGLIVIAAFSRLIPHPANVAPVMAMALFAGAAFGRRSWAIAIPVLAMVISDLALGFHDQMVSVYGSIVVVALLGSVLTQRPGVARLVGASLTGSTVFFLITNFTVWIGSGFYAHTLAGLVECYTLALPFFRNALIGDLVFTGLLFGAWAYIKVQWPAVSTETAKAVR